MTYHHMRHSGDCVLESPLGGKVPDGLIAHEKRIYDFTGFLLEIGVLKAKPL